jgi:glycerol-3-phosphate dehydrogenase
LALKTRSQALEVATLREFDLVVIGGGIVGASVAQDAASRGLSVLLLEKDDFAAGISSRSTKLVHGGLDQLEHLHFQRARAMSRERALLEQLAPHLIRDFSFILPLRKTDPIFNLKARLGLSAYDVLCWNGSSAGRHSLLSKKEVLEHAPALLPDHFIGGLSFHDCFTDDSRLVLEVIKSASQEGAHAINYMEVTAFEKEDGKIQAVQCHDRYSGSEVTFRCKMCVNAAGVWSDQISRLADSNWTKRVNAAKGTHIMVQNSAFETNCALLLPTKDKRHIFVVPWQRALMIGCTDTDYSGPLQHPLPGADEIEYLLSAINQHTQKRLQKSDVIAAWTGLRPLIGRSGAPRAASQQTEIIDAPAAMINAVGATLSNYRLTANQVVDKIVQRLPPDASRSLRESRTHKMMLGAWTDKNDFLTITASIAAQARRLSIEPATLDHLIASYGKDAQAIVDLVEREPSLNHRICPDFPPIMAEVAFCVVTEMSVSLEDLLFRRMRLGMIHQKQCLDAAPKVAMLVQSLLGWDNARTEIELSALETTLKEHMVPFTENKKIEEKEEERPA